MTTSRSESSSNPISNLEGSLLPQDTTVKNNNIDTDKNEGTDDKGKEKEVPEPTNAINEDVDLIPINNIITEIDKLMQPAQFSRYSNIDKNSIGELKKKLEAIRDAHYDLCLMSIEAENDPRLTLKPLPKIPYLIKVQGTPPSYLFWRNSEGEWKLTPLNENLEVPSEWKNIWESQQKWQQAWGEPKQTKTVFVSPQQGEIFYQLQQSTPPLTHLDKLSYIEQTMANTHYVVRSRTLFSSVLAGDLRKLLNAPEKMGLSKKYGKICHILSDVTYGKGKPYIKGTQTVNVRNEKTGKVTETYDVNFDLRKTQQDNFMNQARALILRKWAPHFKHADDEYIETSFKQYFSKSIYPFHKNDTFNDEPDVSKFRMQIIIRHLMDTKVLGQKNVSHLFNPREFAQELEENKKKFLFLYVYQQLCIYIAQIKKTNGHPIITHLKNSAHSLLVDGSGLSDRDKCVQLRGHINVSISKAKDAHGNNIFKRSNLANTLEKFKKEVLNKEIDAQLQKRNESLKKPPKFVRNPG